MSDTPVLFRDIAKSIPIIEAYSHFILMDSEIFFAPACWQGNIEFCLGQCKGYPIHDNIHTASVIVIPPGAFPPCIRLPQHPRTSTYSIMVFANSRNFRIYGSTFYDVQGNIIHTTSSAHGARGAYSATL